MKQSFRVKPLSKKALAEKLNVHIEEVPWKFYLRGWYFVALGYVPEGYKKTPGYYPDELRKVAHHEFLGVYDLVLLGKSVRALSCGEVPPLVPR